MSINTVLYTASAADFEAWKKLGLNSLYTENLNVNGNTLSFDRVDATIPVNTYDGANNLVTADVFSINIHAVLVGHIAILTIAAMGYTAPGAFNYFGFQLPTDFIPNSINVGLLFCSINATPAETHYTITTTGQVRIFKNLASANFALNDVYAALQQSITYDNSN